MTVRIFGTHKGDLIRRTIATALASTGVVALVAGSLMGITATSATATPATPATITGYEPFSSDANHVDYWDEDGQLTCTKMEFSNDTQYVLQFNYVKVIVKAAAGNVGDYANTIFGASPSAGQYVWADSNGNGVYDPDSQGGDKAISHVIFCSGTPTTTPPTTTPPTTQPPTTQPPTTQPPTTQPPTTQPTSETTKVLPTRVTEPTKVLPKHVEAGLSFTPLSNNNGGSGGTGLIVAGSLMLFASGSVLLAGRKRGSRQA